MTSQSKHSNSIIILHISNFYDVLNLRLSNIIVILHQFATFVSLFYCFLLRCIHFFDIVHEVYNNYNYYTTTKDTYFLLVVVFKCARNVLLPVSHHLIIPVDNYTQHMTTFISSQFLIKCSEFK